MKFYKIYNKDKKIFLKKLISKSLIIGLLLNSTSTSFAGILSQDGRYETFEGNNITIDNILEEDIVDVEIEGNTLVNLTNSTTKDIENFTNINATPVRVVGDKSLLKKDTYYTLIMKLKNYSGTNNLKFRQHYTDENGNETTVYEYNKIAEPLYSGTVKHLFKLNHDNFSRCSVYFDPNGDSTVTIQDIMILEGDWSDKEIPGYFEEMKSVGELENNSLIIKSSNKNLAVELEDGSIDDITGENIPGGTDPRHYRTKDYIKVVPGSTLTYSTDGNPRGLNTFYYDKNKNFIRKGYSTPNTIKVLNNAHYIRYYHYQNDSNNPQLEHGDTITEYVEPKSIYKTINLKEPLRAVSNDIKDRIIKRNGQWVIERRCKEVVLDGTESWIKSTNAPAQNDTLLFIHGGCAKEATAFKRVEELAHPL